jgi:ATP-binding cassette subfamily F protein uup
MIKMDDMGAWDFEAKVQQILSKLKVHNLHQTVSTLSGGQRKRIALARTLIDIGFEHKHVLLIMDEPTNHLDVEMVEWLEHYLNKENVTLILVTHDRYFLDNVCNEIWEMDEPCMCTGATTRIFWRRKRPAKKAKRPALARPEIFTAKNWSGCASSQRPALPNQKAGRIIFTK